MKNRQFPTLFLLTLCVWFLAAQLASAADGFAGRWIGTYANSTGETGRDSLVVTEGPNGELRAVWTGNINLAGRRTNATSAQLSGRTAKRSYQITATVRGNAMTMQYLATRLDSSGTYSGAVSLRRQ